MRSPRTFSPFVVVIVAVTAALGAQAAEAAEPHLKFLRALKDRGYFNTALEYLSTIESDPGTPADVRAVVPYERAPILIQGHTSLVSLEEQRTQLNQAEADLDRFVKANPNHPLAGRANADRANLLLSRARVDIWDADAALQPAQQREMQGRARGYLTQAKTMIAAAADQHGKDLKAFPTIIPESDKARHTQRDEAKARYMQDQLDAAEIVYWEARAQTTGTVDRRKGLEAAGTEFEKVFQQYRSDVGGMFARIWQGKCFEELGEVGKALGIYDEILKNDDNQAAVQSMKDAALHFRLVCLNHEQRKDYGTVIDEAEQWLKAHPERANTADGLGIQWELCRSLESIGNDRNRSEAQRRGDLNQALDRAKIISRKGVEQKAAAARMVQRLTVALDRKGAAPRDFESAYAAGSALIEDASKIGDEYKSAFAKGDSKKAAELMRALRANGVEASKLFIQALRLKTDKTEPEKLATARLQLAYAYFLQGRYYDCAVTGEHQMKTLSAQSPETARSAGFLAMSAVDAAISSGPRGPSDEADWLAEIGQVMVTKWPESDQAQDARILLGKSAWNRSAYPEAAKWWTEVPPTASQYATAQISAGQAFWKEYAVASQRPEADRPSSEQLANLKKQAIQSLERGISQRQGGLSSTASTPDDLVLGKLTLAQIRNLDGQYKGQAGRDGAIELLTKKPHDVISAVAVGEGETRPTDPSKAKSAKIASVAYQHLLRSYVGIRDLDAAREARQKLEQVAGSDNPQALTAVYVEFGRELQRELSQLRATGETDRANKTRQAFEDFLNDLAKRSDGQSFTSLLWIAETFAGLADDAGAKEKAQAYTQKSAEMYERMLARADEAGFLPAPNYKTVLRLNLAINQRRQKDFPGAEKTILALLTDNPGAPDVQAEAANLYEDWGRSEGASGKDHLLTAISGRRSTPEVWGWSKTVQRLQREPAARRTETLNDLLLMARERMASAEIAMAQLMTSDADKQKHLNLARHAVYSFIRSTPGYSEDDYARFNRLYASVLRTMGQPVTPLPRDASKLSSIPAETPTQASASPVAAPTASAKAPPKSQSTASKFLIPLIVGVGLTAAGGMVFYWYKQSSEKRRRRLERRRAVTTRPSTKPV